MIRFAIAKTTLTDCLVVGLVSALVGLAYWPPQRASVHDEAVKCRQLGGIPFKGRLDVICFRPNTVIDLDNAK